VEYQLRAGLVQIDDVAWAYNQKDPRMPMTHAALNVSNITGWTAAGFDAQLAYDYVTTVQTQISHLNLLHELR
jgi:hypothetical protein